MQHIRLYKFSPNSKPPLRIKHMYQWFKHEVNTASIEPVDTFEISNQGPINGSNENRPLAIKIFKGMLRLKKVFESFKKRL